MKLEHFKAGNWRQQFQYKSFSPAMVNQQWTWEDPAINTLLEKATRALGELNAFSLIVPDIDLFIQMHVVKEAQSSSKIEGTQTGIEDALMPEEQIAPEKRNDWREVHNYIDALTAATAVLQNLPLSNRLIKQTHETLMSGVRGEHKQPGEFRISQNWIGGSNLSDAVFIPPHHTEVMDLMSDLEKFWHNEEIIVPELVKAAITHYQFETVHPFLDGNGRIGRLLIPLYFISKGLLHKPSLYLSDFFERNRAAYVDALMRVRMANDLILWIRFFLNGVCATAEKGRDTFHKILLLRSEVEPQIHSLGRRAPNGMALLLQLYRWPVITVAEVEEKIKVTKPTANAVVREFRKLGILKELSGRQRYRVFCFERLF